MLGQGGGAVPCPKPVEYSYKTIFKLRNCTFHTLNRAKHSSQYPCQRQPSSPSTMARQSLAADIFVSN